MADIVEMLVTPEFLADRLFKTETFQIEVDSTWRWPRKTVVQWGEGRTSLTTAVDNHTHSLGLVQLHNPETKEELEALHGLTVQCLKLIRSYYPDKPAILQRMSKVTARGDDWDDIVKEANELEIAWEDAVPEADRDTICRVTLAQFRTKRLAGAAQLEDFRKVEGAELTDRIALHELVNSLWGDCKNWYLAALAVFPPETPEGQKLRATIPTQDDEVSESSSGGGGSVEVPEDDTPASGGTTG